MIINIKFEWSIVCCTWKNVPTANWRRLKWGRYKVMNDKLKCNIDHPYEIEFFRNNLKWTIRKFNEREICHWISYCAKIYRCLIVDIILIYLYITLHRIKGIIQNLNLWHLFITTWFMTLPVICNNYIAYDWFPTAPAITCEHPKQ